MGRPRLWTLPSDDGSSSGRLSRELAIEVMNRVAARCLRRRLRALPMRTLTSIIAEPGLSIILERPPLSPPPTSLPMIDAWWSPRQRSGAAYRRGRRVEVDPIDELPSLRLLDGGAPRSPMSALESCALLENCETRALLRVSAPSTHAWADLPLDDAAAVRVLERVGARREWLVSVRSDAVADVLANCAGASVSIEPTEDAALALPECCRAAALEGALEGHDVLWRVDETALLEPALRLERCVGGARQFYLVEATNAASAARAGKLLPVGSLWAAHVVGDKRGGGLPGAAEARALRRAGCGALAVSWKAAVEAARTRAGTKKAVATTLQGSSRIGSVGAVVRTAEFRLPVLRETLDTWVDDISDRRAFIAKPYNN